MIITDEMEVKAKEVANLLKVMANENRLLILCQLSIVGVRQMANLDDSIKATNLILDAEDLAILDAANLEAQRLAADLQKHSI